MIVLTPEHVEQLRTPAGGFNQRSMEIIGCWPLSAGWQQRLIGMQLSESLWRKAVRAAAEGPRHIFRGNTRRRR